MKDKFIEVAYEVNAILNEYIQLNDRYVGAVGVREAILYPLIVKHIDYDERVESLDSILFRIDEEMNKLNAYSLEEGLYDHHFRSIMNEYGMKLYHAVEILRDIQHKLSEKTAEQCPYSLVEYHKDLSTYSKAVDAYYAVAPEVNKAFSDLQ